MGSDTLWQIFVNILDKYFKPSLKPLWSQVSLILARSNPHVPFEGLISDHIVSMRITYYDILSEAFLFFYFLFFFFFFMKTKSCIHYPFLNKEKPTAKVCPKPYPTLTQGDMLGLTRSVNAATLNITWKKIKTQEKKRQSLIRNWMRQQVIWLLPRLWRRTVVNIPVKLTHAHEPMYLHPSRPSLHLPSYLPEDLHS